MYDFAKDALDFIAIACIWLGCFTLYRRLRNWHSRILLACVSTLLLVSTVGVWVLGWHNSRPFVEGWVHDVAVVFADSLLPLQFWLLVISSVTFLTVSLSVKRPN